MCVLLSHGIMCITSPAVSCRLKAHIGLRGYAAPAWWDFSTSADRLFVEIFLRRS